METSSLKKSNIDLLGKHENIATSEHKKEYLRFYRNKSFCDGCDNFSFQRVELLPQGYFANKVDEKRTLKFLYVYNDTELWGKYI